MCRFLSYHHLSGANLLGRFKARFPGEKLMQYKEDFEKVQLWLACKCGYKERSESGVVYVKEFHDCVEDKEPIPITRGVLCPYCGFGQAGFFEEWVEIKPKIARTVVDRKTSSVILVEHEQDSGSDKEVVKWTKERLRRRKKGVFEKKTLSPSARRDEKRKAEEKERKQRKGTENPKNVEKPEALAPVMSSYGLFELHSAIKTSGMLGLFQVAKFEAT
ncbi:hypothetical protein R1flu_012542 [Riccia fluitans]|uniref:Uncharacterized protein n=1 Tax=Riccia fluitans TaxID=41844 RepID=A0ABD1ZAW1_9MARC